MSYQVIARKYRPQRFADVVGQEHVTQTLGNAIKQNRIAHAYLFVGPRGTGKTTIARIFAKCLNATGGPNADFPEDDPKAKEIAEGRSLDVLEIDGASNRGIDEIRDLRETVKYAPASSKFKIYIIDEVHMLTKEAFNALLKTLEEPPAHVKFMFATTEPDKVLPTILSRCQRFDLRRIPSALIVKHLAEISKKEGVKIDEPALLAIARGADGGMRDAESTLDQLISFCGNEIAEADVLSMFGLAAQSQIIALTDAILVGNAEDALRQLNDLAQQGKDLGRLVTELLGHFRNLLIFQVSKGDMRLVEASESEAASLKEQSSKLSADALTRMLDILTDCEGCLRDTTSKKILVEINVLKMIEARNAVSLDNVLKQLQQLRSEGGGSGSSSGGGTQVPRPQATTAPQPIRKPAPTATPVPLAAPAPQPKAVATTSAQPAPVSPPPAVTAAAPQDVDALWDALLPAVQQTNSFTYSYLVHAHPVSLKGNVLEIGFGPDVSDQIQLIDQPKHQAVLVAKLTELGIQTPRLKFSKTAAPLDRKQYVPPPEESQPSPPVASTSQSTAPWETPPKSAPIATAKAAAPTAMAAPTAAKVSKEDFKNDPLIKKALEIFKGQIVDVRQS
jgi:DNA polymerase-3 subunit gamma/tau